MVREASSCAFDAWTDAFAEFVGAKGKVEPGEFRAFGREAPGHKLADAKLIMRNWRMKLGMAPTDSSPAVQETLGLNRDRTLHPARGEGEKLRG
jgi:hypothetical protein